jgi:myo-inositol-1(or 4)-monophosphatase
VLGIESADPRWVAASIDQLVRTAHRLRAFGSIASTLCQVAAARFDGMVSLRRCRGVDAAAAQLIVREAGGFVSFPSDNELPLDAPLDAAPHAPVIAARSLDTLHELEQVPQLR